MSRLLFVFFCFDSVWYTSSSSLTNICFHFPDLSVVCHSHNLLHSYVYNFWKLLTLVAIFLVLFFPSNASASTFSLSELQMRIPRATHRIGEQVMNLIIFESWRVQNYYHYYNYNLVLISKSIKRKIWINIYFPKYLLEKSGTEM